MGRSNGRSRDGDSVAKETVLLQIISFSVVCDLSTWPEMKSKQQPAAASGKQQQRQQHTNKFA